MGISIPIAFVIGLFSTAHCLGMCGSIASALSLSLPAQVRGNPPRLALFLTAYNLGRLLSYAALGALIGLVGAEIADVPWFRGGRGVAQLLASSAVIAAGLYLTGWFPQLRRMDRLGEPLWRRIEPIGRRLLPIRRLPQALVYGLIWGLLPCGLVYYVLLLTLSTGSLLTGAMCMLSFGVGTLPGVFGVGLAAGWFSRIAGNPLLRQAAGLLLVGAGVVGFWLSGDWT